MEQQLNPRAETRRRGGLRGGAPRTDEPRLVKPEPAWPEPPAPTCGEDGLEARCQADQEDPFSDSYIECIIKSEFSEPIPAEDILLKSFGYLREGPEPPQEGLAESPLLEYSLQYVKAQTAQEFPQQVVGGKSRVECAQHMTGKKLPPGEIPKANFLHPEQPANLARNQPIKATESDAPGKIVCPHSGCRRQLKDECSLKRHLVLHGPRNHVCAECGRAFHESTKLKRHFMIHTGERPFRCTFEGCGKRFALDYNLRTHVRIHTGEKRFVCPVEGCHKRFVQSNNMKAHILTHARPPKNQ